MGELYKLVSKCIEQNIPAALCIIVQIQGSTPRKAGAKMLVFADGKTEGTIGGGALEQKIREQAMLAIENGKPLFFHHHLGSDHKMSCGGSTDVYIEPIGIRNKLIIFGAGHIGKKLAEEAARLQFAVTVIDEREEICNQLTRPDIKVIAKNYKEAFSEIVFDKRTFVASISHNHEYDRNIVAFCARQPHAYLGMIGSKKKIETTRKIFLEQNILTEEEMLKIDWPMGVDIACQTPDEIVVSILAKLIDVRGKLIER